MSELELETIVCVARADSPNTPDLTTIGIGPQTMRELHEDAGVDDGTWAPSLFADDAARIMGALKRALPCGTMDALLRLMLEWRCEQVAPGAASGEVSADALADLARTIMDMGLPAAEGQSAVEVATVQLRELWSERNEMDDKVDDLQETLRLAEESDLRMGQDR